MRAKLLLLILLLCAPVLLCTFHFEAKRLKTPARPQSMDLPRESRSLVPARPPKTLAQARSFLADSAWQIVSNFEQWAERYATAAPDEKTRLVAEGVTLATERRRVLAELIEFNPEEALRQAVPMRVRRELPPEIVAQLEERVSGRGEFRVIAILPAPGAEGTVRPIDRFALLAGQKYQAFVYGRRVSQTSRTNIPLHGVAIDGKLAVHEDPVRPLEPGETPNPRLPVANPDEICGISGLPSGRAAAAQVGNEIVYFCSASHIAAYNTRELNREEAERPTAGSGWTSGIKTVLFMRLNFPDDLGESISMSDAISMMNNASNWFEEVSYHMTGLKATVTPLLTMPRTKSSYQSANDPAGLLADARALAKANGFDTANFDLDCINYKYIFSGFSGSANVGGKGMWLQSGANLGIACHEFGHNYGLFHANSWNASDDTIIGPGAHEEYGNIFDTMGMNSGWEYQFNACHKNRLGWIPEANVATITNSGVYRIYAFDVPTLNSNLFYALRVKKDEREYWGELRSQFTQQQFLLNGIMLNWSPWAQSNGGTHLLDTTPGTDYGKSDCTVTLGRTFSDPFAGIHLTPVRVNTNTVPRSIDVVANLGTFPGNHPPTVTVSASPTSVAVNAPVTFTATASDPDGDALAYFWEFRDPLGELGTNGPMAVKRWTAQGEYVVRCIVSDMKGGTAIASVLITVGSPSGFRISGRILNGSTPIDNVRVFGVVFNAYTDANGNYLMTGMSPGDYPLFAYKPGWVITPANFANPVPIGPSASNVNFSATPGTYTISGRVYSGETLWPSVAIPDVAVKVGTNSVVTDINGYYSLSNFPPGVYSVTAVKPGYELREAAWRNPASLAWANADNLDFVQPFYQLRGFVTNVDYAGVRVDRQRYIGAIYPGEHGVSYVLEVPRGLWNLTADTGEVTIVPDNFANPVEVTNQPPEFVRYNFIGSPGTTYAIRGTVTEAGQPLSGALLSAGGRSGGSDTFGNYVLPGFSNGNYQLNAGLSDYVFNPATRSVTISGADLSGQDFAARLTFRLAQMCATNAGFAFRLSGGSNRVFRIEASTNLTTWATLATVTNATGQFDFVDSPLTRSNRFYRAAVLER